MKKVVLISCVSKKLPYKAKAEDLYISPYFKKNMAYAKKMNPDSIYILSAKYGLLDLETEIEPYNLTLNKMSSEEVKGWSERVLVQLAARADLKTDRFIFLAGIKYRKYLTPMISFYEVPLANMAIGIQMKCLNERL
jgi:hypothetical protein